VTGELPLASKTPALGVIDSLSAGFGAVNRIIWILLFPLVLDLFLWLGPQVSMAPIARRALSFYDQISAAAFTDAAAQASGSEVIRPALEALGSNFNLLSLLMGSLISIPSAAVSPLNGQEGAIQLDRTVVLAIAVIALVAIGTLLGCLYLGLIAHQVRDGRVDFRRLRQRVWTYWLSVLGYGLMLLGLGIGVGIASSVLFLLGAAISIQIGIAIVAMMTLIWSGLVFVLVVFTFFLTDAIVISEVGPWQALVNSVRVVSQNVSSTLGFMLLTWVILGGTQVIWTWLPNQTWGSLAAILANAYVGSGLAAASLVFYHNRFERLSSQSARSQKRLT
jgi:hypothetical protein